MFPPTDSFCLLLRLSPYSLSPLYCCLTAAADYFALPGGSGPSLPSSRRGAEAAGGAGAAGPGGRREARRAGAAGSIFPHCVLRPLTASSWHPRCRAVWLVPPCAFRGCLRTGSHFLRSPASFPNSASASSPQPQSPKQTTPKMGRFLPVSPSVCTSS